jgi:hypothetical protein
MFFTPPFYRSSNSSSGFCLFTEAFFLLARLTFSPLTLMQFSFLLDRNKPWSAPGVNY